MVRSSFLGALQPVDCKPTFPFIKDDFSKFLEGLLWKHTNPRDKIFDRVAECRSFDCYFTKKRFHQRCSPSNLEHSLNNMSV